MRLELWDAQLDFVEAVIRREGSDDFGSTIREKTEILAGFLKECANRGIGREESVHLGEELVTDIVDIFEGSGPEWKRMACDRIEVSWLELKKLPRVQSPEIRHQVGKLNYAVREYPLSGIDVDLSPFGVREGDIVLDMHMDAWCRQDPGEEQISVGRSLERLTEDLEHMEVENPEEFEKVKGVFAISWILDHPAVNRVLKFHVAGQRTDSFNRTSTWTQLVTSDGKIDPKRLEYLKRNGELQYKVVAGFMPKEEFMSRFVPDAGVEMAMEE